jgi:ATP-binding cassette, subfamily B, bacterial
LTELPRSIFRKDAMQRYLASREEVVLLRWVSPSSFFGRVLDFFPGFRKRFRHLPHRRVPVRLQLSAVECGAACLAMILSYFGRPTQVADCREKLGIGRDGITAEAIARAAREYGLRVKAYSVEDLSEFKYVPLPAIAHWNFEHFVVIEHWSPQRVEIIDPGGGRRRLKPAQFAVAFTGVVLTFEPGVQFDRHAARSTFSWRAYLLTHMSQVPGLLFQILSASFFLQILGLALPALTKILIDQVLPRQNIGMMPILGIGMVLLVLTQVVLHYLRATVLIALQVRLDSRLMVSFFEHLLTLPFRFFEQRTTGDLLMRLSSNTIIRETLSSQTLSILLDGVFILGYLVLLLVQEPSFGLAVLGIGLAQIILLLITKNAMHDLMQQDLWAQSESQSYLVEALKGIETLKASGAEDRTLDHWSNLFFKQLNVSLRRSRLTALLDTAMLSLRTLSPLLLLWFGALYVLNGSLSLGSMLAFNAIAIAILTPLATLVSNGQHLQLVGAHLERLADVLEAESEQDIQLVQAAPTLSGQVELKGVGFRYDAHAPWVLRDISLAIAPGQKIALVGRSGSGKSTLAKLLLGLYLPTEGEIRYDDWLLQTLNWRSLRSQFGVVLQEPSIFSGSIRQNITLNHPNLSLEQVIQAAKLSAIHEDILRLPMGYETRIAEGGSGLSGGQLQRLAIARALAHQPAILVLDEATSHLDVKTERQVEQQLSHLSCTRIVIAHRLSTVRNADRILVMDAGRLVEQGNHRDLLAQQGLYASLVQGQLK